MSKLRRGSIADNMASKLHSRIAKQIDYSIGIAIPFSQRPLVNFKNERHALVQKNYASSNANAGLARFGRSSGTKVGM